MSEENGPAGAGDSPGPGPQPQPTEEATVDTISIRTDSPEVTAPSEATAGDGEACIHCYGSGWILDPAEEDEDRTYRCHMCSRNAGGDEDL